MSLADQCALFRTIKENMRWGKKDASIASEAACKPGPRIYLQFKDGYDTMIERGEITLSGGQRQRLCIARALLMNPRF